MNITILDKDYTQWVKDLTLRYRASQIKAAVKVNHEQLQFYYTLGEDIVALKADTRWGNGFLRNLSKDLQEALPGVTCFSETNLKYMKYFYELYNHVDIIRPQVGDELQPISPQLRDELSSYIFSVPWGHHKLLIDKFRNEPQKALFYVRKTIENGWSRSVLLNWISTDLYEREGKALTNFEKTLPDAMSDLAKELTKDPYNFAFAGVTGKYNERLLKDALLRNITDFLVELGTGFAYVGKEYRIQVGERENFIDLLFYNRVSNLLY